MHALWGESICSVRCILCAVRYARNKTLKPNNQAKTTRKSLQEKLLRCVASNAGWQDVAQRPVGYTATEGKYRAGGKNRMGQNLWPAGRGRWRGREAVET